MRPRLIFKGFLAQAENIEVAEKSLETNKRDLELMKDYATTTEVSTLLHFHAISHIPAFCGHYIHLTGCAGQHCPDLQS